MPQLRYAVRIMREQAQERMRQDRERLWPNVPDITFNTIVAALGEISVIEARTILTETQEKEKA